MVASIIVGLIILVVVVLFLLVVLWGWWSSRSVAVQAQREGLIPTPGLEMTLCNDGQCQNGLECDPFTGYCKIPVGGGCRVASDCVAPAHCSGVCVIGETGGLNQYCPCNSGYTCVTGRGAGPNLCKGSGGAPCSDNADCASLACVSGLCRSGQALGTPCSNSSACNPENTPGGPACSGGYCQLSGVTTGGVGAVCDPAPCDIGLVCSRDPNNETGGGICASSSSGLLQVCSITTLCPGGQVCLNSEAELCEKGNTDCVCRVSYPDPNQSTEGVCPTGMVLFGLRCFNGEGLGCESDNMCSPGLRCAGGSTLTKYGFLSLNVQGSRSLAITPVNVTSTADLAIKKLFTLGEVIYASCSADGECGAVGETGLWDYGDTPGVRVWRRVLAGQLTRQGRTLTFIDASVGPTPTITVLFSESDGIQTFPTLYSYNLIDFSLTPLIAGIGPWPGIPYYNNAVILAHFVERQINDGIYITAVDGNGYVGTLSGFSIQISGVRGPMRPWFRNSNNFGYTWVSSDDGMVHISDTPISFPTDPLGLVTYEVVDYDVAPSVQDDDYAIALCRAYIGSSFIGYQIVIVSASTVTALPYQVAGCSRVTISQQTSSYYVASQSSCSAS
jgi:hypothetical protein